MLWDKYLESIDDNVNAFLKSVFMSELVECIISTKKL